MTAECLKELLVQTAKTTVYALLQPESPITADTRDRKRVACSD
jgi:hypothetical protein